ncbi:hypothetical protein [Leisingera methylohalidivorans]|uniref:Translocase n=1 Tax=Leisingera methylohalidivorans DSM 14336 TaxID=999552 RepID=V9VXA5_9RHOB|nr:hypothetical protein [Leisingera methylohalidivorans]AHD02578.1 hypothetical protein METH_19830 [Leisingera methylohalidivorans DSM 14336]
MLSKQVMLTSALTLACALGIGFFMQSSGTGLAVSMAGRTAAADPELPGEPDAAQLRIEKITLTSVPAAANELEAGSQPAEPLHTVSCQMTAAAEAAPIAMVRLSVEAACRPNERLTVHHSGMTFTASLDQSGRFSAQVPALAGTAVFIAETASGSGAVAVAEVDGLDAIERIVLQWTGNSGFEIHAREFGAAYGSAGHVWRGAAGAGQVVRLGDDSQLAPRIAEIYSLPRTTSESGTVSLTAEAEVTEYNCGRDISAQALQLLGGQLTSRDLVMAMPDCDAKGSFLVLNNLVEDLKIATN